MYLETIKFFYTR